MDVLESTKITKITTQVLTECITKARYYIKKRKPDIAAQYTALGEHAIKSRTSHEANMYKVMLESLNTINELTK